MVLPGPNVLKFKTPHCTYVGKTRTGKTYKFYVDWDDYPHGGIYFNYTRVSNHFVKVNGDYDVNSLIKAVKAGEKLSYATHRDLKRARKEVAYITYKMTEYMDKTGCFSEDNPIVWAIDECHNLAPEGQKNESIEFVATGGGSSGFKGVFLTQSPSMMEKILFKQAGSHVIFTLDDYEREYFENKKIDFVKIQNDIRSGIPGVMSHMYCIMSDGQLIGPFQE